MKVSICLVQIVDFFVIRFTVKNGEIPQFLIPQLRMIIDNLAGGRLSSTTNKQPKGWMARYESFLSRRYPKAHAVHKMVIDVPFGNNAYNHTISATSNTSSGRESLRAVTKEELLKLAVIVILIPLPFTVYIFALAVFYLKSIFSATCLDSTFLDERSAKRFWSISLKRTARMHIQPLRKYLQNLNVNLQASLEELKKLELPEMNTYSIGHLYHLSRLHRVSLLTGGIRGFHDRAEMLRHLDHLLRNEDTTIDMMSEQQLCEQFYLRRLQYDGLTTEKMKCLLKNWIQHMTDPCLKTPLFLHAPAFETALKNAAEDLKPVQKC
ncbi:hypothetical protein DINM_022103 [Dirofilaria immitis]|nr:hypothetical protein [Dirofilaria immitis]